MTIMGRAMLVLAAGVTLACAGTPRAAPERTDPGVITATELADHHDASARQVIERLRPGFLRTRGTTSISYPEADRIAVYVDNARMGGVEFLDQIRVSDIAEIRHLSAAQATMRYGTGNAAGAIVITLH